MRMERNYYKFIGLHHFESYCISCIDQYSTDALMYLQTHPIIYLAKCIITRLCASSVY